jgi:hypothetical protein
MYALIGAYISACLPQARLDKPGHKCIGKPFGNDWHYQGAIILFSSFNLWVLLHLSVLG